jgi:hypothetical protein
MIEKKYLVLIALLAIILVGNAALNAVEYEVVIHVNGPSHGYYQIPIGSANHSMSISSAGTHSLYVIGNYPTNFLIVLTANFYPYLSDSYAIGLLDPFNPNHVYLDVTGVEPEPEPEPIED